MLLHTKIDNREFFFFLDLIQYLNFQGFSTPFLERGPKPLELGILRQLIKKREIFMLL